MASWQAQAFLQSLEKVCCLQINSIKLIKILLIIVASKYAENQNNPDIQFYFGGFLADCAVSGQVGELSSNYSRSIQIFPAVLHPKSRGYITLKSSDPLDPPKIFANYLDEDHDIKVLVEGIRFAIKLADTSALKAYGIELDKTVVPACATHTFGTQVIFF